MSRVIPPHRRDPDDSHDSRYYRRGVDDIRNVIVSTAPPVNAEPGALWYNPEGVPDYGVDIGISKDDADQLYTSKDEFAAVADVPPRVEAVETQVQRGDKTLSLRSAFYNPAADGVTDDRAALQALLDDGAGGTATIAKGHYRIVGALTVPANTEVVLQPGTVIDQATKYTPVFDIINADDVVIRGNGARLRWTGSRSYTGGGSFRYDDTYNYGAGVWSNSNRTKLYDLRASGFTCGVYLSAWNGTNQEDYSRFDNEIHGLVVENVDFGVLASGQVNPVIRDVRGSYSLQTGSGNPSHLIYVTKTARHRNIDISGLRALDGAGGHAFMFKGVDGGQALNLHAYGCPGLLVVDDAVDLTVDARIANDLGNGEIGSVMVFGATDRCTIDVHSAAANGTTGFRLVSFDPSVRDTIVRLSGRQRQPADGGGNYAVRLRGTRNTVEYAVNNLDDSGAVYSTGRPAIWVESGSGHTVRVREARGVTTVARVDAGAVGCVVEADGDRIATNVAAQALVISEPTTILRREGAASVAVTGAGQTVRIDGTRFRTVHVNVTTADAFTITTPYGTVPRGTRLTYIISNASGGTMGTVTWTGHTVASAWTNPAAAQEKSIEFIFDGVRWKEIGRTA